MRIILLFFAISSSSLYIRQENENYKEAIFYYQNNWKVTREMALERGLIESFQILETPYSDEEPFHIVLITTFKNKELYDNREEPYFALVKEMGDMRLLNDKKPDEFKKVVFTKRNVKHLN